MGAERQTWVARGGQPLCPERGVDTRLIPASVPDAGTAHTLLTFPSGHGISRPPKEAGPMGSWAPALCSQLEEGNPAQLVGSEC